MACRARNSYQFTAGKLKDFGQIDTVPAYDQTIDRSYVDAVLENVGKVDELKY